MRRRVSKESFSKENNTWSELMGNALDFRLSLNVFIPKLEEKKQISLKKYERVSLYFKYWCILIKFCNIFDWIVQICKVIFFLNLLNT